MDSLLKVKEELLATPESKKRKEAPGAPVKVKRERKTKVLKSRRNLNDAFSNSVCRNEVIQTTVTYHAIHTYSLDNPQNGNYVMIQSEPLTSVRYTFE